MRGKVLGKKNMIRNITEEIRKTGLADGKIVICHSLNEAASLTLKEELQKAHKNMTVDIRLTRRLDIFYDERNGLIIAF